MGWHIPHLPGSVPHVSYGGIAQLIEVVEEELPERQFRPFAPLAVGRGDTRIEFPQQQARAIRDALREAADRLERRPWLRGRREAREWAVLARDIAEAADTAARSGRPWVWS